MTALLLLAGLVTVALDQATKQLATSRLAESRLYAVAGGAGVRRVVNERGSLVALSLPQAALAWIVAVASVASAVALASPLTALGAAGLGLVVGGATSNLADRIGRGGVVDFIALGRWPAFNLADAAMACGLAITAWSLL